ncbi:hypothetical protein [Novosphingobium sp. GV055]|uniref:hypothetical protein n=1 Tax=Novosphingobium sp. GV055 TaxID=2135690 RepID=UPI001061AD0B|nr:hypothetical protein [Novosphingobium sp. GV055]
MNFPVPSATNDLNPKRINHSRKMLQCARKCGIGLPCFFESRMDDGLAQVRGKRHLARAAERYFRRLRQIITPATGRAIATATSAATFAAARAIPESRNSTISSVAFNMGGASSAASCGNGGRAQPVPGKPETATRT